MSVMTFDFDDFEAWVAQQPADALVGRCDNDDNPILRWQQSIEGPMTEICGLSYTCAGVEVQARHPDGGWPGEAVDGACVWPVDVFVQLVTESVSWPEGIPERWDREFKAGEVLALL